MALPMTNMAIEVCGGADKIIGIGDVEARFHFDMILENEKQFKGSYPLASASATVGCR